MSIQNETKSVEHSCTTCGTIFTFMNKWRSGDFSLQNLVQTFREAFAFKNVLIGNI